MMKINQIATHWHETDRAVFTANDDQGLIEVDMRKGTPHTALIWHLWVNEEHRGKGIASALLKAAEGYARQQGKKYALLQWDRRDTPQWVRDWYQRNGYALVTKIKQTPWIDLRKEL